MPVAVVLIVAACLLLSIGAALAASPFGLAVAAGAGALVAGVLALWFGVDAARDVVVEQKEQAGSG